MSDEAAPVKTSEESSPPKREKIRLKSGALQGNGRPKGRLNDTTLARLKGKDIFRQLEAGIPELNLKPAVERWCDLLKHRKGEVRVQTEKFVHEALHGKARQRIEMTGTMTFDASDALRAAAEAAAKRREARTIEAVKTVEIPATEWLCTEHAYTGPPPCPKCDVIEVKAIVPTNGNGSNGNGHHD